jgi:hypothetical protein
VTENNQKKIDKKKTRDKERTKSPPYIRFLSTRTHSREIQDQEIKPKRRYEQIKRNEKEQGKEKEPNHACAHRNDRSFVVIEVVYNI